MTKIAIIGAGIAGLTLAHRLQQHADITIFEKSRGVGGRVATRYADPFYFDHGAQYFTVKTKPFAQFIQPLINQGILKVWQARFIEFDGAITNHDHCWSKQPAHYVAVPGMNAFGKYLADQLNPKVKIRLNCQIQQLNQVRIKQDELTYNPNKNYDIDFKKKYQWQLVDANNISYDHFDWVICTAPAAQSAQILPNSFSAHHQLSNICMKACFSMMLGFDRPLNLTFDAALVKQYDISWISVNSAKPDRSTPFSLLVNSTNHWADQHIDDPDQSYILNHLITETSKVLQLDIASLATHKTLHAWRYANMSKRPAQVIAPYYLDQQRQLAACGDWCIQGRVEAAFTSADCLATVLTATAL